MGCRSISVDSNSSINNMSTLKKNTQITVVVEAKKTGDGLKETKRELDEVKTSSEEASAAQSNSAEAVTTANDEATTSTKRRTEATNEATDAETNLDKATRKTSKSRSSSTSTLDAMTKRVSGFAKVMSGAQMVLSKFLFVVGAISLAIEVVNKLKEWSGYNKRVEAEAKALEEAKKAATDYASAMERLAATQKELAANEAVAAEAQRTLELVEKRRSALQDIVLIQTQEAQLAARRAGNQAELAQLDLDLALTRKQITQEEYAVQSAILRERAADEQRSLKIAESKNKLSTAERAEQDAIESNNQLQPRVADVTASLGDARDAKYLKDLLAAHDAAKVVADQTQAEYEYQGNRVESRPAKEAAAKAAFELRKIDDQLAKIREGFAAYGYTATATTAEMAKVSDEFFAKYNADQQLIKKNDEDIKSAKKSQLLLANEISTLEKTDALDDDAALGRIKAQLEMAKVATEERKAAANESERLARLDAEADDRARQRDAIQEEMNALQSQTQQDAENLARVTEVEATARSGDQRDQARSDKEYYEARLRSYEVEMLDLQAQLDALSRQDSEAQRSESDLSRERADALIAAEQHAADQSLASLTTITETINANSASTQQAFSALTNAIVNQGESYRQGLNQATTAARDTANSTLYR